MPSELTSAQAGIHKLLDSTVWDGVMITSTLWALFIGDLTHLLLPKAADIPVATVSTVTFLLFSLEIVLNFYSKHDYGAEKTLGAKLWNLFFLVDLAGTLSLVPEILLLFGVDMESLHAMTLARAGRAARVGARVSKLMRIVSARTEANADQNMSTKVGQKVSDQISKRVVALVLAIIIAIPSLTYYEAPMQTALGLELLEHAWNKDWHVPNNTLPTKKFCKAAGRPQECELWRDVLTKLDDHLKNQRVYIVALEFEYGPEAVTYLCRTGESNDPKKQSFWDAGLKNFSSVGSSQHDDCANKAKILDRYELRPTELGEVRTDGTIWQNSVQISVRAVINIQSRQHSAAALNLLFLVFCTTVMLVGSFLFTNDIHGLVVEPVERITVMMKRLEARMQNLTGSKNGEVPEDENEFIKSAVQKIGSLLKMVYGEAGSAVISRNMRPGRATVEVMTPGTKAEFIFMFCDIREFTATTECLLTEIMAFTNKCGSLIHQVCQRHFGCPNKNVGDAFMIVWKPPEHMQEYNEREKDRAFHEGGEPNLLSGTTLWKDGCEECLMADHAYMSVIESVDLVNADETLKELSLREKLQARFPNYRTRFGFGLHAGWAIEGPIGSKIKIDCSYLGPHMAMSERLETATKIYGVTLLMSEDFVNLLSDQRRRQIRKLDRVMLHGLYEKSKPIEIWGIGLGDDEFNPDIRKKNDYMTTFEDGIDAYIAGDWTNAKQLLETCKTQQPNDKPGALILNFMAQTNYKPPEDWDGWRNENV